MDMLIGSLNDVESGDTHLALDIKMEALLSDSWDRRGRAHHPAPTHLVRQTTTGRGRPPSSYRRHPRCCYFRSPPQERMTVATLTLPKLERHLWGAADLLRGSIDSGDFKHYSFGLLFYKRLCDVWQGEYENAALAADLTDRGLGDPDAVTDWKAPRVGRQDIRRVQRPW